MIIIRSCRIFTRSFLVGGLSIVAVWQLSLEPNLKTSSQDIKEKSFNFVANSSTQRQHKNDKQNLMGRLFFLYNIN